MSHSSVLAYRVTARVVAAEPGVAVADTRLVHKAGGARKHFDCCIIEDYN